MTLYWNCFSHKKFQNFLQKKRKSSFVILHKDIHKKLSFIPLNSDMKELDISL